MTPKGIRIRIIIVFLFAAAVASSSFIDQAAAVTTTTNAIDPPREDSSSLRRHLDNNNEESSHYQYHDDNYEQPKKNNNNNNQKKKKQSPEVTRENIARMKTAVWLNQEQVAIAVGFQNQDVTPYPPNNDQPYDVTIDPNANCYVVFRDPKRTTYDMIASTDPSAISEGYEQNYGVFLSHASPCGVCSNLVDLAVYLEKPDLTNPVRLCGFTSFVSSQINEQCLVDGIGFSGQCGAIWLYNTQHTRNNCIGLCLALLFAPNNLNFGVINPCEPVTTGDGTCQNTINGGPACPSFQYEWGSEFRLNACLQCDECKSGPLFQKIAGRTRRDSGIQSGIERPDIPIIDHNYFTNDSDDGDDYHRT